MKSIDCSIIIVNYNTCTLTIDCINSIALYSNGFTYEIIVVDNASTDNSAKVLSVDKRIKYVQNPKNAGFGAANNLGVQYSEGKYIFLLNSDTILLENSIEKFLKFYSNNEQLLNIGALGGLMIDRKNNIINSGNCFPTSKYFVKSYLRISGIDFKINEKLEFQEIDFVTGANLFISKAKYTEVQGFDENFFLYYEETDFQKRLTNLGYKNYLFTDTRIIHLEGGSDDGTNKISNFKRIVIAESKNRFLRKHDSLYFLFAIIDLPIVLLQLLNNDYSKSENKEYLKRIFNSYFS
ncbi:MAG: glycosyltransferase family 2 protein [Chryseobacterium sp.]